MQSSDDSKNVTPLHIAAGFGHLACLQLLVQLGGDIMARDSEQLTPVDYASVNGQDLCLNYLSDVLGMLLIGSYSTQNFIIAYEILYQHTHDNYSLNSSFCIYMYSKKIQGRKY